MKQTILLIAVLGITACGGTNYEDISNLNNSNTAIVCFGDSLTKGYGANKGEDYPSVLASIMGQPVINAGKNGDTSAQGLARIQQDVLSHKPRIVIVEFSGNDFIEKVSKETTRQNLNQIIRHCKQSGSIVVLVHCKIGFLTSDPYLEIFRELAKQHNVLLIEDILDDIFANPARMSDPIHPNAQGYALMAQRIAQILVPLIQAADATK